MHSTLKNRIAKLEAIQPEKESSLAHLSDEELDAVIYENSKTLAKQGIEPERFIALHCIISREFCKDAHWVRDANHRINVFQGFLGIAYKQNLPEKIKAVFGLGWRNVPVPPKDIGLTVKALHDADLGE